MSEFALEKKLNETKEYFLIDFFKNKILNNLYEKLEKECKKLTQNSIKQ
jgi:hypothetical protein